MPNEEPFVFMMKYKIGDPVNGVQEYGEASFTYPSKVPTGNPPELYAQVWGELVDERALDNLEVLDIHGLIDARIHEAMGE